MFVGKKSLLLSLFLLTHFFCSKGLAQNLGELSVSNYYGPLAPEIMIGASGEGRFLDEAFLENFLGPIIQDDIFELKEQWVNHFYPVLQCPNSFYKVEKEYFRYLYRLLAISYLYEGLKVLNRDLYRHGMSNESCAISWEDLFNKCRPKSNEMSTFLTRSRAVLRNPLDWQRLSRVNDNQIHAWLDRLSNISHIDESLLNISELRFRDWRQRVGDKTALNRDKISKIFSHICRYDKELIQKICSENDSFFSFKRRPALTTSLIESHALAGMRSIGLADRCLDRFSSDYRSEEEEIHFSDQYFKSIYHYMFINGERYIQGPLFLAGALREFDHRGLELAMFKAKPSDKEVKEETVKEIEEEVIIEEIPEVVAEVKEEVEHVKEEEIITEVKKTYISQMIDKLRDGEMTRIKLDMGLFHRDFIFTDEMINSLRTPLTAFQTRDALIDMKEFDGLGNKEEPARLLFLKYLIDQESHQGLFNFIDIIGGTFWVINDIDRDNRPVRVSLQNDQSTQYQWQLTLLSEK